MLSKSNLHNYQVKAINHILANYRCGLFLDMGLGKTVSTLTAIEILMTNKRIRKPLIIGTKRVAETTWSDELEKWEHLQNLTISKILGTKSQRIKALKANADLYIINRENVEWLVTTLGNYWDFDMVVIDELTSFKSPSAKRFKALRRVLGRCKRVVGLTGTPAPKGLMDLWAQLYLIDNGERLGKTITSYRNNYFRPGWQNGYIVYSWNLLPSAEDEINRRISDICISMDAKDYLELPPLMSNEVEVKLTPSVMQQYKDFEREKILELGDTPITSANAAVLSSQLRQYTSGAIYIEKGGDKYKTIHDAKIDALLELCESISGNILIGYEYRHELERIRKALPEFRMLDTPKDIRDWNDGKIKVAGGHPASMGHGLNLQRGGSTIIWVTPPWSLELYQQFNARLYRQGQSKPVMIHHLVVKGSIDKRVMQSLKSKDATQRGLMEAIKTIRAEIYGKDKARAGRYEVTA